MSGEASSARTAADLRAGRVVRRTPGSSAGSRRRPRRPPPRARAAAASIPSTSGTVGDVHRPRAVGRRPTAVQAVGRRRRAPTLMPWTSTIVRCLALGLRAVGAGVADPGRVERRPACGPARRCRRPASGWTRSSTRRSPRRRARRRSPAGRRSSGSRGTARRRRRPASRGGRWPGRRRGSSVRPARARRRSRSCRRPAGRPR